MSTERATRDSDKAAWMRVARSLEDEIRSGDLSPGQKLPVEPELAERFGVGRHTLRRAIADLADRGLLSVRQGSGMYVKDDAIHYVLGHKTRFTEIVSHQNRSPNGSVVSAGEVEANDHISLHLNVAVGTPCVLLETMQRVDGEAMSVVSHFFPATRFRGIVEAYRETGSISLALERFDAADYVRLSTTITAAMPNVRDARLLDLPRNMPIILHEAINVDRNGTPIEYGFGRSNPLRMRFVVNGAENSFR